MARNLNLLIDKLRTRAWAHSFLSELQGLLSCSDRLTPTDADAILNNILNGTIEVNNPNIAVKDLVLGKEGIPNYTSQFHRWKSGETCISSTNKLINLFRFSQLVFKTGIPQCPAWYNVRIPDEDFETFPSEEAAKGKTRLFEFYDAPPLWVSIKGTPAQILKAWKQVPQRGWIFWHPDNADVDIYEIDLTAWKWSKPLPQEHYSFKDVSELAYTLDRISDIPVPPIVNLAAQIAAARLIEEETVCLGPHFPSNEVQIELKPFGIELDEIWSSLDEVGCPPRFI